jgi:putative hydrolase of the HAD superfamily
MMLSLLASKNVLKWPVVIFDLDDTLYPESQYVYSGFAAVSKWLAENYAVDGMQTFALLTELHETGVRGDSFDRMLAACGLTEKVSVSELVKIYRSHSPVLSTHSWVVPLLQKLRARGAKVGLISDGYLEVQRNKWVALSLNDYFEHVLFTDSLGRELWKPSTVPFETMLKKLSATPNEAVYIGDNAAKDFKGPNTIGMASIQVKSDSGCYSHVVPMDRTFAATYVIENGQETLENLLLIAESGP